MKFEESGAEGIVMCYAQLGSYEILDVRHYEDTKGGVRTTTTRDVVLHPETFPFRTLEAEHPEHRFWTLTMLAVGKVYPDWRVDSRGRIICRRCGGYITDSQVSCEACKAGGERCSASTRPYSVPKPKAARLAT